MGAFRGVDEIALDAAQAIHPPGLDLASSVVGLFGQAEVTAGIALGLAVARLRRSSREALLPLFIAVTVIVESALKIYLPQLPPPHERSRVVEFLPFVHVPFAYSFPSGHVARAAFLLSIARIPRWVAVGGIILMALTRVYLAEHWLSDTVGGAVLGLAVASLVRRPA